MTPGRHQVIYGWANTKGRDLRQGRVEQMWLKCRELRGRQEEKKGGVEKVIELQMLLHPWKS